MTDGPKLVDFLEYLASHPDATQEEVKERFGAIPHTPVRDPQPVPEFSLDFTPMAEAWVKSRWSMEVADQCVRQELATLASMGCKLGNWRGFTTVALPGQSVIDDEMKLVVTPFKRIPLVMRVDTGSVISVGSVNDHLVTIPIPDTPDTPMEAFQQTIDAHSELLSSGLIPESVLSKARINQLIDEDDEDEDEDEHE